MTTCLFFGPSGSGKTFTISNLCNEKKYVGVDIITKNNITNKMSNFGK